MTLNGERSDMLLVSNGVPQGFILDPLLFLILINIADLDWDLILFADDTTLCCSDRDISNLRLELSAASCLYEYIRFCSVHH